MLMMFGHSIKRMPLERAIPFDNDDLMVIVSPEIGFRLCNIASELGEVFSIKSLVNSREKVFGKVKFEDRVKDFAEVFQAKLERFFVTQKIDYLFFDGEEQREIRKVLCKPGLSCSVEIYRIFKDKPPEILDFLSLEKKEANKITKFLSACSVRTVIDCREYYYICNTKGINKTPGAGFERKNEKKKTKENEQMEKFFKRYSKLSSFKSKEKVNNYFKKLVVKYHPDKGGDPKLCAQVTSDFNIIKKLGWYLDLPEFERKEMKE